MPASPPLLRPSAPALLALAGGALAAGLAVYALARDPGHAQWWPAIDGRVPVGTAAPVVQAIAGSLPEFAHVLAFALLTAVLLPAGRAWRCVACLGWAAIDLLAEAGQHPALHAFWEAMLAGDAAGDAARWSPLRALALAERRGTFDWGDVAAIATGAGVAWLLLHRVDRRPASTESTTLTALAAPPLTSPGTPHDPT